MDNLTVKKVICSYLLKKKDKVFENNLLDNLKADFFCSILISITIEHGNNIMQFFALKQEFVFIQT